MTIVPNKFPTHPVHNRIALIGEAPGKDEVYSGEPFVGQSGQLLSKMMSRAGVRRESCFLGNICQYQPTDNQFSNFAWDSNEVKEGLNTLRLNLLAYNPNIVVLLGNVPLKAAKDPDTLGYKFRYKNANWRGSMFVPDGNSPMAGFKCISTYHPAYVLRDYTGAPYLQFDLRRAVRHSTTNFLAPPKRLLVTDSSPEVLVALLNSCRRNQKLIAIDIEGYVDNMSCISIATCPTYAFIVPFSTKDHQPAAGNHPSVWRALAELLEDPVVPKVLQNSLYDRFILQYSYSIYVRGVVDDTMLKHWELYCELEKALEVQTSLYTEEPYYKSFYKGNDETFFRGCCMDSAVTHEINHVLEERVDGKSREHYRFNMSLLEPLLYMELRGLPYDAFKASMRRQDIREQLFTTQAKFNGLCGTYIKNKQHIWDKARKLAFVRSNPTTFEEIAKYAKKANIQDAFRISELMRQSHPTLSTLGELENCLGISMNVESPKQLGNFFYDQLGLPEQFGKGEDAGRTTNYEALLKLSKHCLDKDDKVKGEIVQHAINIRSMSTREGMLGISTDPDGRVRCGYNVVGGNAGRVTCHESPTGSGYNLQVTPEQDRDLFPADVDHWYWEADLRGADGWTVAAYAAYFGDNGMLEHYRNDIKPYSVLALKVVGKLVNYKDMDDIKSYLASTKFTAIEKMLSKRVQHGAAYLEGGLTISRNILTDSEGQYWIPSKECDALKNFYLNDLYPGIPRWQNWVIRRIHERPVLTAASGQTRHFFGRSDEIPTKAVAFEPQANTTYVCNTAMRNLWYDPENRMVQDNRPRLRVDLFHQMHDALSGQFKKTDTAWASGKIKSWFNNPLVIAGQRIVIPYEGGYGPDWGACKNEERRVGVL